MLQAKGFESQSVWIAIPEFDLFDLWTKNHLWKTCLCNNFYMQDRQESGISKIMTKSMCLGWALSVAKHLFWSPVSHLPWHCFHSLAKANDHVPLIQAWCLWHFNCKIICYNPPSLNSQIPGPHSENHTWEYNPSTLWRLFESRPVQTDYTIRWLWDSSPSIKLQVFKYTTDAFVCIL